MARLPRYGLPGQPQHVIQRGNNREPIFFSDADYLFFLECLKAGCEKYRCDIHAYVLMTNHVHLLVSPQDEGGISKLMQSVGRRYVQYVNFTIRRTGSLWEGRYRATPIDTEGYLLTCYRYIELNPVRANMVDHPRQYRWSSYAHHALEKPDPLIRDHELYLALGKTPGERVHAYRALFRAKLDEATLDSIRGSLHRGWVLGSERFRKKIEAISQRRTAPLPRGGKRPGAGRPVVNPV